MSALMNSEKPALVSEAPGRAGGTNPLIRKEQVPMAVSVRDGIARPRLHAVGSKPGPGIEVKPVNVEALAQTVNAFFTGQTPTGIEVGTFDLIVAAIYKQGFDEGMALGAVS